MFRFHRILVPMDFSPISHIAVKAASRLADGRSADLFLLHAIEPVAVLPPLEMSAIPVLPVEDGRAAQRRLEGVPIPGRLHRLSLHRNVIRGEPEKVIIDHADEHDIDVIVMGTHSRTGLSHFFLGSVTESVVRHAKCPVLTVPASAVVGAKGNVDGAMN